jgi:short-subunit dehydrogenase
LLVAVPARMSSRLVPPTPRARTRRGDRAGARGAGVIVNLGSWIARLGIPVGALYSSTKGAMER